MAIQKAEEATAASTIQNFICIEIEQAPFNAEGFASTGAVPLCLLTYCGGKWCGSVRANTMINGTGAVWDSSIVVAKLFEKHDIPQDVEGKSQGSFNVRKRRCLDLSAGCGLVGDTFSAASAIKWMKS